LFFLGGDDRVMVGSYTISGDSFAASVPRQWSPTQVLRDCVRQNFDVSPDGQRFLMLKSAAASAPRQLHLVVNWFEELKRLVPAGK
jgi:hypothetical protein